MKIKQKILTIAISFFAITMFSLSSIDYVDASIKLKKKHKFSCSKCHSHKKPKKKCSSCHPGKDKKVHRQCKSCHRAKGVKTARARLGKYIRSGCRKCHK